METDQDNPPASMIPAQETGTVAWKDEATFRREHMIVWWGTLIGPFVATGFLLFLIREMSGPSVMWRVVTTALATFFLFGKFIILGGSDGDLMDARAFFTAEQLVALVLYLDAMTACLLAFHLGFLFRLPVIGPKLSPLVEDGHFILQSNPWMRRMTFVGLVVFVMFPLAATGSVGGSIFGRLLGMSRLGTFAGITLGNILGCALMYFGSELITRYIGRDNPWLMIGGIVVVTSLLYLLNRRYRQLKAKLLTPAKSDVR